MTNAKTIIAIANAFKSATLATKDYNEAEKASRAEMNNANRDAILKASTGLTEDMLTDKDNGGGFEATFGKALGNMNAMAKGRMRWSLLGILNGVKWEDGVSVSAYAIAAKEAVTGEAPKARGEKAKAAKAAPVKNELAEKMKAAIAPADPLLALVSKLSKAQHDQLLAILSAPAALTSTVLATGAEIVSEKRG